MALFIIITFCHAFPFTVSSLHSCSTVTYLRLCLDLSKHAPLCSRHHTFRVILCFWGEAMEKYLSKALAAGLIHPYSSPAGAGFFFVGKKDGSLRPCIDYQALNNITVKNRYPLPLMSTAFELLQGATIFSKLDLRKAYHLGENQWKTAFNKTRFIWDERAERAFQKLKRRFATAPILIHPDPKAQFIVELDASIVGVGAILSYCAAGDSKVHSCAFYFHHLSPAEQNYDIGNKELLAIKLALEEWRQWLEGAQVPFQVWTDHMNLEYLQTAKRLNSRQARWALFFSRFNFHLAYRPGSKNVKPDALSRYFESPAKDTLTPSWSLKFSSAP